ncbi:hypothetical protein THAOC_08284, partial [Thalassiosira oceanica]
INAAAPDGEALLPTGEVEVAPITTWGNIYTLQSVLATPLKAFAPAHTSSDDIRQIETTNQHKSQDLEGLPPVPRRKRRRVRKRKRTRRCPGADRVLSLNTCGFGLLWYRARTEYCADLGRIDMTPGDTQLARDRGFTRIWDEDYGAPHPVGCTSPAVTTFPKGPQSQHAPGSHKSTRKTGKAMCPRCGIQIKGFWTSIRVQHDEISCSPAISLSTASLSGVMPKQHHPWTVPKMPPKARIQGSDSWQVSGLQCRVSAVCGAVLLQSKSYEAAQR